MTTWYAYGSAPKGKTAGWSHGSEHDFDKFSMDGHPDMEGDDDKHWNCHIGPHFTSLHSVAEQFADKSGWGGDKYPGHVYHVGLDMKNPKHYDSEHDMDKEAHELGKSKGLLLCNKEHGPGGHADCIRDYYEEEDDYHSEPAGPAVAEAFKNHLHQQGYDGITYGNEHEGPKRHKCAIAFGEHQIKVYSQHAANQVCPEGEDDEDDREDKKPYQPAPIPGQMKLDYGKFSSIDLVGFFKAASAPNYNEKGRLEHYRFKGHEPAEGEHAIFRGVFLGHETGEKDRPTEPADVLKHIEDHQRKHLERHGVDPEHERMNNYGSHWTTDAATAHKFALDPNHGKWRSVRHNTKYPAVGAVLEIHTTEKPSTGLSQYGENELDSLPKRSQITRAWLHVHRNDPTLEAPYRNEDHQRPDTWSDEFAEKMGQPKPVSHYQQNTLLSTTEIQVPHTKKQSSLFREAINAEDELPPKPGTAPIPKGHIRLFHYTDAKNLPSIREHGLLESHARGDSGDGNLRDPSAGVWASTHPPKDGHIVEFHAHPDEISDRAESPHRHTAEEFQENNHHVIMRGDVKPEQIVAIHEPWHGHAHYILDSEDLLAATKRGANDHAMQFPDYAKAITHVKKHGAFIDDDHPVLYHSTRREFKPGDRLVPPAKRGINYEHPQGEEWRNQRVWAAKTPEQAHAWGDHKDPVYEVRPIGAKEHEPTNYDFMDGEFGAEEGQVQARGATVLRKMDDSELGCCGQPVAKTAGGPLIFYPAKHGGKYHLTDAISGTARCRGTVEVDKEAGPIHIAPDQERIHPMICKRCLDSGRSAQSQGKHVSGSLSPEYRLHYGQSDEGHHIIDAYHGAHDVGSAVFDPDGTLNELNVNPEHQRKGLATAMWDHAKSLGINPQHSNVRSRQGDAWAKSTGDPVPENVWPSHPDDDADDVENDSFSTAFTAPGYHHPYVSSDYAKALGYESKNSREAALHELTKPSGWSDSWMKSEEEQEADRKKRAADRDEFNSKVKQEAGLPEDTPNHKIDDHWRHAMRTALTKGDIDIDTAEKRGYSEGGSEHGEKISNYENYYDKSKQERRGGWKNLAANSPHYFHVSTDVDSVSKEGLKTRRELNQADGGVGLGGGSNDTVSVTDDGDLPHDIYHSLHEHHAVVTGKITPQQLYDYAKNPPHGMKPFHQTLVQPKSHQETDFDQLKRGRTDEVLPGHPAYQRTERDATPEEHTQRLSEFYKRFSRARQHVGGGHRDPLFMSNDPVAFSKADPEKFGIMTLKPHPKAQGYPLGGDNNHHSGADSGEWRLGSGSPFEHTWTERPYPRHLEEFENYPAEKKSDHDKFASISDTSDKCHCASCNSLGMIPPGSDCVANKTKSDFGKAGSLDLISFFAPTG
jgi:hypothetical protein